MPPSTFIPQRPYLLRAMHSWITDNGLTPHVVVDATMEGVDVPRQYVRDGKIVLNISHTALSGLDIGNEILSFNARFSGNPFFVQIPLRAVLGIYARENGRGMIFSPEDPEDDGSSPEEPPPGSGDGAPASQPGARKPHLTIIK